MKDLKGLKSFPATSLSDGLTERDLSRPAAARLLSVFVLRDDDGRRRRREVVDQKEHALGGNSIEKNSA